MQSNEKSKDETRTLESDEVELIDKRPLRGRSSTSKTIEFILEKDQTLSDYLKLKKQWDKKLHASGFHDIEFVKQNGVVSHLFHGYSSTGLGKAYDWSVEEYYRRAGLFLYHANWRLLYPKLTQHIYKFIWQLWTEGHGYVFITAELKKKHKELKQRRKYRRRKAGKPIEKRRDSLEGCSLYWVHTKIKEIEQAMLQWIRDNPSILD